MGMSFIELGSLLRSEREKQGFSIDDVANRLKISARVLRAVECADDESLPHSVYVRGFVISYAKLLNLDVDELLTVSELYDPSEDPSNSDLNYIERRPIINKSKIIFILFIGLCVAVGTFVWMNRDADLFSQIKKDHLTVAQPAPPATSSSNGETSKDVNENKTPSQENVEDVSKKSSEVLDKEEVADNTENTSQTEPVVEQNPEAEVEQVVAEQESVVTPTEANTQDQSEISPPAENAPANTEAEAPQNLDGPHKVIITAVAECWIHSNADGTDTRQFSLRAGDTFALTFDENLTLKLGNAGGVRIRYNGAETPIPGRDGEVKTLTFPLNQ